jgi:hypothetical protein
VSGVGAGRLLGALVVAFAAASVASAADDPAAALSQAVQRSNNALSSRLSLSERINVGTRTVTTLRMRGVQRPRAQEGAFTYAMSPAKPGLGQARIILHGSTVYVHYPILDTLRATDPHVKKWLVVDARSNLGIDATGLDSLGMQEIRQMTGLRIVGSTDEDGLHLTRYAGTLPLSKIARSAQIKQLLGSLPSAASALMKGTERLEVSVGSDGFIHRLHSVITAPLTQGVSLSITVDAELSDFNRATAPIAVPPARDVMTTAQFQQVTGSGSSAADTALLQKVVLTEPQVGAGYKRTVIPGGKIVDGETTLDFCDGNYPSESLRTARLQVAYSIKGNSTSASNEVVTYRAGGAQQALEEVRHTAATCPNGRVATAPRGVKDAVRRTRLISDPHLLPGSVAVLETDSATVNGKRMTHQIVAVYQVRGNVLSGVYAAGTSLAAVKALALHAAEQSATNLRRSVAPTPAA